MLDFFSAPFDLLQSAAFLMKKSLEAAPKATEAAVKQARAAQTYWTGLSNHVSAFMAPSLNALNSFAAVEKTRVFQRTPLENAKDYGELLALSLRLASRGLTGSMAAMNRLYYNNLSEGYTAWIGTFFDHDGYDVLEFAARQENLTRVAVQTYPEAMRLIESECDSHFESGGYARISETERFELFQVLPRNKHVRVRDDGKPILIVPPYVPGPNILAFLPEEQRSYVHCFAEQGIPTYIRIVKDIDATPAVQIMTGEDDALDLKFFCESIKARHGRKVTLNGFCQGGYQSVIAVVSGVLDGLVDALITCAAPMDGSRSKFSREYLTALPSRFRDIAYSLKTLPNGNQVVDARIMGLIYRLRRMESESPIPAFHRTLSLFDAQRDREPKISRTAAAASHWIAYDRKDLPAGITRLCFESYTAPVAKDGTLPVALFGRKLNFRRIKEMGIPWLICIAENDDLLDKESALAPLDYIEAEVCVFPKGHAAISTSWSIPEPEGAPQLRFCIPNSDPPLSYGTFRGPVSFHLDLEKPGISAPPQEPSGDESREPAHNEAGASGDFQETAPDYVAVAENFESVALREMPSDSRKEPPPEKKKRAKSGASPRRKRPSPKPKE